MKLDAFKELISNMDERDEITDSPNLRPLILEARDAGLIKQHPMGKMRMQDAANEEAISLFGKSIPILGTMWPVYVLTDDGRGAIP